MTLMKRLWAGASVLACSTAMAAAAMAGSPQALTAADARAYAAAFDATERGDFIEAQMETAGVQDQSLVGYLSFRQLMHPTAHKAAFDELAGWLSRFRDLPVADKIFALAAKRKPPEAQGPPAPVFTLAESVEAAPAASDRARQAREAFYAGDVRRALAIAPAAGDRWIAGLAAYRLKAYDQAQAHFGELARDGAADPWVRSAAGYWGARSAQALGDGATATLLLKAAARSPETFYGMIAERQLHQAGANTASHPLWNLVGFIHKSNDLEKFVQTEPRAHRAAALAQIGRPQDAAQELRAGIALATTDTERASWTQLAQALGVPMEAGIRGPRAIDLDYPMPTLEPQSGFTVDKALVYAIVRQESRFNPLAVSPVGATGLMQLMPEAAARAAGDDKLKADMSPLFEPAFNLRVGQDYLSWLMERGVGYDILRTVAAYNGGPGAIQKTQQMLGDEADSLLLIECLPALETRNYVEKVMAADWTYRKMWGQSAPTLDALASGARFVDARLDLGDTQGPATQRAAQPLEIGMR